VDYQKIRNKINDGKKIIEKYKDETPQPVLEVCYSMFDINEMLVDKLEELDNKISKNSRNSSRPPSSDDVKPNQSQRGKSNRRSGGQQGHGGSTLKKVSCPDEIIYQKPPKKCFCGEKLLSSNFKIKSTRQVFDVKIQKFVSEYRQMQVTCSCGQEHTGDYPKEVKAATQYGESIRGIVSYLSRYQLIPFDRLRETMNDLFDTRLSEGSIHNINTYASDSLGDFRSKFVKAIDDIKHANCDETPIKVSGRRGYLHVFSNMALTLIDYHKSRGIKAVEEIGVLNKFKGTLVHDCFSMYFNYGENHAICNAHLLRELTFIEQKYQHRWAHKVKTFLYDLNELVKLEKQLKKSTFGLVEKDMLRDQFQLILEQGRSEIKDLIVSVTIKGKRRGKQHPSLNLLNRMTKLQKDILRFMYDYDIPFTNNQAERDLRMAKVHQKITGGFRSEGGAKNYALFRSYISTVKKHGINVFTAIKNLHNPIENSTLDLIFKPFPAN